MRFIASGTFEHQIRVRFDGLLPQSEPDAGMQCVLLASLVSLVLAPIYVLSMLVVGPRYNYGCSVIGEIQEPYQIDQFDASPRLRVSVHGITMLKLARIRCVCDAVVPPKAKWNHLAALRPGFATTSASIPPLSTPTHAHTTSTAVHSHAATTTAHYSLPAGIFA